MACYRTAYVMDVMRKLMAHGGGPRGGRGGSDAGSQVQDNSLGLMHLRKLFAELKQPPSGTTQTELENMLYNMLPLFCKVIISYLVVLCVIYIRCFTTYL